MTKDSDTKQNITGDDNVQINSEGDTQEKNERRPWIEIPEGRKLKMGRNKEEEGQKSALLELPNLGSNNKRASISVSQKSLNARINSPLPSIKSTKSARSQKNP